MNELMQAVEQSAMKSEVPFFEIGDLIDVHVRILEGEKERIQIFSGTCIARSGGGPRSFCRSGAGLPPITQPTCRTMAYGRAL